MITLLLPSTQSYQRHKSGTCTTSSQSSMMWSAPSQGGQIWPNTGLRRGLQTLFGKCRTGCRSNTGRTSRKIWRRWRKMVSLSRPPVNGRHPSSRYRRKMAVYGCVWTMCVDYRRLNGVSEADAYPMPRFDDLIDRLGTAKFMTTLDLTRGYWQVPVAEDSRQHTTFTTPFGLYQFTVMPFGLQSAPATFQRMMDVLLKGTRSYAVVYLDDLVIFSQSWEEHCEHLRTVLQRLREAGLTAKPAKC